MRGQVTSLYFVAAWVPSMQILIVNIVTEKKLGLRSTMRCMGLKDSVFWVAWLLSELAAFAISIVTVVLFGSYVFQPLVCGCAWGVLVRWDVRKRRS